MSLKNGELRKKQWKTILHDRDENKFIHFFNKNYFSFQHSLLYHSFSLFLVLTITLIHILPFDFHLLPLPAFSKCSCYLIACGSFSAIGITESVSITYHCHCHFGRIRFEWLENSVYLCASLLPLSSSLFVYIIEHCVFARFDSHWRIYDECSISFRFSNASGQWNGIRINIHHLNPYRYTRSLKLWNRVILNL